MKISQENKVKILSSFLAVGAGLLVGFIILFVVNPGSSFRGFLTIILGGLNAAPTSLGDTIFYGVPIVLTGLSVAFAFRTGLFNIGATGQMTMGAFVAVYIGVKWTFLGPIHWIVAILGAMLAGAIWGSIPGLLKAFRNVHEVVSSIMLNYIAMYLNSALIFAFIYNATFARAQEPASSAMIPKFGLDRIFTGSDIHIGIFIAILLVTVAHIILNKTTFGYELKSVGFNRDASKYAGINEKRNIVLSMIISGAIAGTAGAMLFLVPGSDYKPVNDLLPEGFTGIAISLLGLNAPIGVLISGLFYGWLNQGGYYVQLDGYKPEIIDVVIGVIIYFSALSLFLQNFVRRYYKRKVEKNGVKEGGEL
jgi:simple sugar transport system permease protein